MKQKISGSKVAANGVKLEVEINDEVVGRVANTMACALVMQNYSVTNILSVDQCKECFTYVLKVILVQDSAGKPQYEVIPQFLSDIIMPLSGLYRGVRIHVDVAETLKRPDSYDSFLDVLQSMGIPTGKILKVDPSQSSGVMKIGEVSVNDCVTLVGVDTEVSIEELVVRSMLNVMEESQDKLTRIIGHMDQLYLSRDELVRQWACSLPVGKRI